MSEQELDTSVEKRYGWIRLYVSILRNPKVAALSSDAARWAYVSTLVLAFGEDVRGEWLDRSYLERGLGHLAEYIDEMLDLTLLVEEEDGTIAVPQWAHWQPISAKSTARVQKLRAERKAAKAKADAQREAARVRQERRRHPERFASEPDDLPY